MAKKKSSPCEPVASGGVGESGASTQLHHLVGGSTSRMMVLRTTETNLCPNTGVVAAITVNGVPRAFGDMTQMNSSIQAEAAPDANVVAIAHTIPLFNGIVCATLGELRLRLDECVLVEFSAGETTERACVLSCAGVETRDWYAWNNKMPPKPDDFHVVGQVQVPNPGVEAELVSGPSKGGAVKRLGLVLRQRPGVWPQVLTWKQVRYDEVLVNSSYEKVEILCGDEVIAKVDVETVH